MRWLCEMIFLIFTPMKVADTTGRPGGADPSLSFEVKSDTPRDISSVVIVIYCQKKKKFVMVKKYKFFLYLSKKNSPNLSYS